MVQVLFTHKCDGEKWMKAWEDESPDANKATFRNAGIKIIRLFRSPHNPNLVGLIAEVESLEAFLEFAKECNSNPKFLAQDVDQASIQLLTALPDDML